MAFIAGIVNPKRIDYNYAGEAAKKEEAAGAAVVDNGAEAVADAKEQVPADVEAENTQGGIGAENDNTTEVDSTTEETAEGNDGVTDNAPTGSETVSAGASIDEANTPIKRGRKPSKKA